MSTSGILFTRKTHKAAKGTPVGLRRGTMVCFDQTDFDWISAMAQQNGIAFQEQVRRLCKLARTTIEKRTP